MLPKLEERQKAIKLRNQGKSYSEILSLISVSQSSLSLWLRNIPLTRQQTDLLLLKKREGQMKGGIARRKFRELQEKRTVEISVREIKEISRRELWLLGVIAYWCEGAKQKEDNVSQGIIFANSDPILLTLFVKWLREILKIKDDAINYSLYIHQSANFSRALNYWNKTLKIPKDKLIKVIFKKHVIKTNRKNTGASYYGLIRIAVKKSTNLNRIIKGWVLGISNFI